MADCNVVHRISIAYRWPQCWGQCCASRQGFLQYASFSSSPNVIDVAGPELAPPGQELAPPAPELAPPCPVQLGLELRKDKDSQSDNLLLLPESLPIDGSVTFLLVLPSSVVTILASTPDPLRDKPVLC